MSQATKSMVDPNKVVPFYRKINESGQVPPDYLSLLSLVFGLAGLYLDVSDRLHLAIYIYT